MAKGDRVKLPFDPIDEAARQWGQRWGAVEQMHAVTSLMRVQQLVLAQLDELLKPYGLTFARYEALVLLTFSRNGSLPLGKTSDAGDAGEVPPAELLEDRVQQALALLRSVRGLWQHWLAHLGTPAGQRPEQPGPCAAEPVEVPGTTVDPTRSFFAQLQDHSLRASWKTQIRGPLQAIFSGAALQPVVEA